MLINERDAMSYLFERHKLVICLGDLLREVIHNEEKENKILIVACSLQSYFELLRIFSIFMENAFSVSIFYLKNYRELWINCFSKISI